MIIILRFVVVGCEQNMFHVIRFTLLHEVSDINEFCSPFRIS